MLEFAEGELEVLVRREGDEVIWQIAVDTESDMVEQTQEEFQELLQRITVYFDGGELAVPLMTALALVKPAEIRAFLRGQEVDDDVRRRAMGEEGLGQHDV